MTDSRLRDVLGGKEDNYLLPFYWQHGNHRDKIPEQIARIRASGCRALCVEARPHPDFCREGWWGDMDCIIAECEKRGMKVWILDDKHFPTGYANGALEAKHPELRPWNLVERHVDVMGPAPDNAIFVPPPQEGDDETLVEAVAYRRAKAPGQKMEGAPVILTDNVRDGTLFWDIPEGCWRVFFLRKSRRGLIHKNYIDLINPDSCAVQIEEVYEQHWQHYASHFGKTIAGFFSDEPGFANVLAGQHLEDRGMYDYRIGQEGLALPYNDALRARMSDELGEDAAPFLGELWYESPHAHLTRLAYMNALTTLYHDCFSRPVGDWCRAHGVEYIGHIIEDMNAHGRMGYGPGHYFRALEGQDMGGIDIVLHQVMPGFADYMHTAIGLGGAYDPDFFDYVLAKLAASISHQCPHMRGRAMCEVFGAYGWAEGAPFMRWLLDFLLVRGVNHFVPHAFSPEYPDPDCPPHFGAEGHDPQFDGFIALMGYANKASHLLTGGRHVASAALLYHAEGEWMSTYGKAMLMQEPARALYDAHLDFDIVCADTLLANAHVVPPVQNGQAARAPSSRLVIGEENFAALVVPAAEYLPPPLVERIAAFRAKGLPIIFAGGVPNGIDASPTPLDALADAVRAVGGTDISFDGDFPLLRAYHIVRDGHDVFMFFNEAFAKRAETTARLPVRGRFARLRLLEDFAAADVADNGEINLDLLPGQSEILVFGDDADLPCAAVHAQWRELRPTYTVEIADSENLSEFRPLCVTDKLFNIGAPEHLPDFAGKARYTFSLEVDNAGSNAAIDLGQVGQTARMWVNGEYAGIRVAAPYRFEIGGLLRKGENTIVVETADTLARKVRDRFSEYLQIPPAGMIGPVTVASR
jgi:hypothetical protein